MASFFLFVLLFFFIEINSIVSQDAVILTRSSVGSEEVYTSEWLRRNATYITINIMFGIGKPMQVKTVDIKYKPDKTVQIYNINSSDVNKLEIEYQFLTTFHVPVGQEFQIQMRTAPYNGSLLFIVLLELENEKQSCPVKRCYGKYQGREIHCESLTSVKCGESSGQCIEPHQLCDGGYDCYNGTDESNCTNIRCDFNNGPCDWKPFKPDLSEACNLFHICPRILTFNYSKPTNSILDGPVFDDRSKDGKSGYMLLKVDNEKPNGSFSTNQIFAGIRKETPVKGNCEISIYLINQFREIQLIIRGEDTVTGEMIDIGSITFYATNMFNRPYTRENSLIMKQLDNPTRIIVNVVAENIDVNTKRFVAIDNIRFGDQCKEVKK